MPNPYLLMFRILLALLAIIMIIGLMMISRATRFERRIRRYTVDGPIEQNHSLMDRWLLGYQQFRRKVACFLNKSKFWKKYSERYQKYQDKKKTALEFVVEKWVISILFLLVTLCFFLIKEQTVFIVVSLLGMLVGFYLPDLYYWFQFHEKTKRLEEDLVNAITIMNNSFQAGNSIMQTMTIVSKELKSPLRHEFSKINQDLEFGLDLETAFRRFSLRVPLPETQYITTTLAILNQTGGNIGEVFSAIERSVFTRRKLKKEFQAATASAQLIFKILIFIPIVMIIVITVLNPSYFQPLWTTAIGWCVIIGMLVLYFLYIVIIRKMMKMEEIK